MPEYPVEAVVTPRGIPLEIQVLRMRGEQPTAYHVVTSLVGHSHYYLRIARGSDGTLWNVYEGPFAMQPRDGFTLLQALDRVCEYMAVSLEKRKKEEEAQRE